MYQAIGGIAVFVASIFWGAVWVSYTLSTLWGWFIAPLFGIPELPMAYAYGMTMAFRVMQGIGKNEHKSEKSMTQQIIESVIKAPIVAGAALLAGYIAKQFI